ncbi:MAG: hypothetical protein LQ339_001164 [Xanthoria mediterranea]|nr:MAG: hypothetical protein LQ339_001164 [Xanthoria mediterranea]
MDQRPTIFGIDVSIGSYGSTNGSLNTASELQPPELRGPVQPFTALHQGKEPHATIEHFSEDGGARNPKGRSPQHMTDGRASETPSKRAEAAAEALNGTYHRRDIGNPSRGEENNTLQPVMAEPTATAENTMGYQAPNEIQTAILLLELHEFDTNQAQQSRMEAESYIEVALHEGSALDRERQTTDLERRITDLERCITELEVLYAKVQQAFREFETAAVGRGSATRRFESEPRRYAMDYPAIDAHRGYHPFPSRVQYEEVGLGEKGPQIKTEEGSIQLEYVPYDSA